MNYVVEKTKEVDFGVVDMRKFFRGKRKPKKILLKMSPIYENENEDDIDIDFHELKDNEVSDNLKNLVNNAKKKPKHLFTQYVDV